MKNIPYYDFSSFPLESKKVLEIIDYIVESDFNVIIINFGEYFPWDLDNIIRSKFTYSEKLLEKIVNICKRNNIIFIPVLSVLDNSDFILQDSKYKHLIRDGNNNKGLNLSSCGAGKLVENLNDDLFSLFIYSNYVLIDIPNFSQKDKYISFKEYIIPFIKRISGNLSDSGKTLILAFKKNCQGIEKDLISEGLDFVPMNYDYTYNVHNSVSYNLDIVVSGANINDIEYKISYFNGTDSFYGRLDIGEVIYKNNKINNLKVSNLDEIYSILDNIWSLFRLSWEDLSRIYRNTDPQYRIRFCRNVLSLSRSYQDFKTACLNLLDSLEEYYQPGFLKEWLDGKSDSVLSQLNKLEDIAKPMSEG